MKGTILDFTIQTNEGVISGEDGMRYTFKGAEWRHDKLPRRGQYVDFAISDGMATGVYPVARVGGVTGGVVSGGGEGKNKIAAGLLALFFGALGIHKFYLGYKKEGLIMLLVSLFGSVFIFPPLIMGLIAFIEFIIYISRSDAEFDEIYVGGQRPWF
jgi:TM2 domain-containing membrane protein YozV